MHRRSSPLLPLPGIGAVHGAGPWLRLLTAEALLFGPARWLLLAAARRAGRPPHRLERVWTAAASRALDLRIEMRGLEHVDPEERYVVAPLHEGLADVLALSRLPLDLVYAARDELFAWRILGGYLSASRQVPVPTHDGAAGYRALLRAAPEVFARGASLVVFPQGTILGIEAAFRPGAFRLAAHTRRPLLPVVVTGTHRVWEHPYSPLVRLHHRVRLEVLRPVPGRLAPARMRSLERDMKARALTGNPGPRRFVPERDGWWDDYPYEIDPAFPQLAAAVARHRADARRTSLTPAPPRR